MVPSLQSLIDQLPDLIVLVGRDGAILAVNRAFDRATGLRRPDICGRPLIEVAATPAGELTGYLRRCSGVLQPVIGALQLHDANGAVLKFQVNGAAMLTEEGRPGPVMLRLIPHREAVAEFSLLTDRVRQLSQEILRRKRIEEELRGSEERLRLAIDAAGMGAWDMDPETGLVECSQRCAELLGLDLGPVVDYGTLLDRIHPEDREKAHRAIQAALDPGKPDAFMVEYRVVRQEDGQTRWIAHKGKVVFSMGRPVRVIGMILDITEQRRATEHQRLLINELNHRVKNTLATVHSIMMQTLRHSSSLEGFEKTFEARLMALSQTHNLLTHTRWRGADLHDLLAAEAAPFHDAQGSRLCPVGPAVHLAPKAVVALGLAFHELTTNAVKYGALSVAGGRIHIVWSVDRSGETPRLLIRWTEVGGPPVEPPRRRGFGSRLIERGLSYDLGGHVGLHFRPAGLECIMDIPLHVLEHHEHG